MLYYFVLGLMITCLIPFDLKKKYKKIFFMISFLLLIFFAGFRGDFTSDYNSYTGFFNIISKNFTLKQIWIGNFYQEKGFVFFNKIISFVSDSSTFFMFIMSLITISCFFVVLKKHSKIFFLSVLMFVCIGCYYDSFNVSRQIMAVSIAFCGYEFIYEKKFIKFIIVILIASMIHRISLLIIPFYFLLSRDINYKNIVTSILIVIGATVFLPILITFFQNIFTKYEGYTYGMSGGSWKWLVLPIALSFFTIYALSMKASNFDITTNQNKVLLNALIFYVIFTFLGTKVEMVARLASYFQPFSWILIPNILQKFKNKNDMLLFMFIIIILLILYPIVILSGTGYDPYYFIWQKGR